MFGGGPDEPMDLELRFVSPRIPLQQFYADAHRVVVENGTAKEGRRELQGFWIYSEELSCLGHDAYQSALRRAELVSDAVAFVSGAKCRMHNVCAWQTDPWPESLPCTLLALCGSPQLLARNRSSLAHATLRDPPEILFPPGLYMGRKLRSAMRWYSRSLEVERDIDQLISLFVAAETAVHLRGSEALSKSPYRTDCNHLISECPVCSRSIERVMLGAKLQAALIETGLSEVDAKALWDARQMVHGKNDLSDDGVQHLPVHINMLRAAVHSMLLALVTEEVGPLGAEPPVANQDFRPFLVCELAVDEYRLRRWERHEFGPAGQHGGLVR